MKKVCIILIMVLFYSSCSDNKLDFTLKIRRETEIEIAEDAYIKINENFIPEIIAIECLLIVVSYIEILP